MSVNLVAVASLSLGLAASPMPPHADQLDQIHRRGAIRIGALSNDPPFSVLDIGRHRYHGLDIDFALSLAKSLGAKPEFVTVQQQDRIEALTEHKVDIVLANFTVTADRLLKIDFSAPYFTTEQRFISRKPGPTSIEQIAGLRIGVEAGSSNQATLARAYPQLKLVPYRDISDAFSDLQAGLIDSISEDDLELTRAAANMANRDSYAISHFAIAAGVIAVGLPKGEPKLKMAIDAALHRLEINGTAKAIRAYWSNRSSRSSQGGTTPGPTPPGAGSISPNG